ncbi:MAG: Hsp20/alpha crystallin family protein, partial [Anaerolineales bacterium]|nr:Hsp20/alpha crystallin family protein [Anaerolineales bacterium]
MSSIIRWEPAREMMTLREAMDRLFDDAFTRPLSLNNGNWSVPAVDMYQTDNEVVVKAALPGIKADDVQIN